ncbi:maltose O-acetyltransferase [Blastococcus aurantiacus]|uniref:Maltose O-acetyltransferase n=1 Tax=Blastococcus aurantiacus TaxID=1550231 RepID=A0A1G7MUM3_9ACTN|nr:acyltransferase [Blastococcus aurantiacus]SDF65444.1 maltose O-acetyltransferase [Blastococcus aurantiacus]
MGRVGTELRRILRDRLVNGLIGSPIVPPQVRWRLLRLAGLDLAKCKISASTWFSGPSVTIGRGSYVNYGCWFDSFAPITIGARCHLAPHVVLVTSTHHEGVPEQRAGAVTAAPIFVGDGTWIGVRATILPGVNIGEGCVVAAGATVISDCEPHGLYAGTPARRVRDLGP